MSEPHGLLFDIRKFSLHDGPGIRTTVFFKGCPLNCWWCHNPESQSNDPEVMLWESRCIRCGECVSVCAVEAIQAPDAGSAAVTDREICTVCGSCMEACTSDARQMVGRRYTVAQVMQEVLRDAPFYEQSQGGVTFSGGEPLAQRAFLAALLKQCKALGLHTALDTSGYAPWKIIDSIRADVDLFLYDLKIMDDTLHRQYTGVPNGLILHNLRALAELGHEIIVRIPVIPGVNDGAANLQALIDFIASLPQIKRIDLLPYHAAAQGKYERLGKPYHLAGTPAPDPAQMDHIQRILEDHHLLVKVGG